MSLHRTWTARWINGETVFALQTKVGPAPYLRTVFECGTRPKQAFAYVAAPGWHELYINGQKVDDRVLSPVLTQFEKHVSYVEYDITSFLNKGKNAIAVCLGNGWYNCHTIETWQFKHAPWRDYPKLLCEVVADHEVVVKSGKHWKTHPSPVIFDGLRTGENYDARLEIPDFANADYDDSNWKNANLCNPPGGLLIKEELDPCKVTKRYPVIEKYWISSSETVYDFGTNLTGNCEITVEGPAGGEVIIQYSELVSDNFEIERSSIAKFVKEGEFQTEHYLLRGDSKSEVWKSRFTYHGFRYAKVLIWNPAVTLLKIEACFIHNNFKTLGEFVSSDTTLNRLQKITRQSYLSNFTGIPTDCPHREKNGWTGDASLALETGLWNFDGHKAYEHFIRIFVDTQRANGQLPGIAPTGGWGFNWGSGPAWDSLLFEAAYQIYRFYGDNSIIIEHYEAMKKYLSYCESMADDARVDFGLGDWCHVDRRRQTPSEVTSTGYYYSDAMRMALFAKLLNKETDEIFYTELAAHIYAGFNRKYNNGDGTYADSSWTALGAAVFFGLADNPELTVKKLAALVCANNHKIDFGILGAKYIPRVLADYGYADDAFLLLTQPEFPGWGFWVKSGATTLWENWNGRESRNHIMYGDVSAWMYQYLGGINPLVEQPGFKHFEIKPCFVSLLNRVSTEYKSVNGLIKSNWIRNNGKIKANFTIPRGCTADIILPGKTLKNVSGEKVVEF